MLDGMIEHVLQKRVRTEPMRKAEKLDVKRTPN